MQWVYEEITVFYGHFISDFGLNLVLSIQSEDLSPYEGHVIVR